MLTRAQWQRLAADRRLFTSWFLSALIQGLFLVFWAALQAAAGLALDWLATKLSLLNSLILGTVELLFAVATLCPIIAWMWKEFLLSLA